MKNDVLTRFRNGIKEGRYTLSKVQEVSKIPLTALSEMKNKAQWGKGVLGKMQALESALDVLDKPVGSTPSAGKAKKGRKATRH